MDNTEKQQVTLPPELAKRYTEATTDAERGAVMKEFARTLGAEDQTHKEAAMMSDEQFRTFLSKVGEVSAEHAKAAVSAVAEETVRTYNLNPTEAQEVAQRSFETTEQKMRNRRSDMEMAAKVFRGIFLARQGKPDAYGSALDEEAEYYKRTYRRDIRAMSLTTDTTGGYLAPTLFSDMLYENIARTSLVRKFATMIPMRGNEVINIPTMTATLTAAQTAEAAATAGSEPTFSQKQLTTKKIVTKSNPVSIEMIEKANPAIVQLLLRFATIEILKKEDSLVFGTAGNGIRASAVNNVTTGSAASGYDSIDFDDMISLESELTAEYLTGADIQGSGIIDGVPRYWLPHALVQALKKKKETGTGAYLDEAKELRSDKQIFGYDALRVLSLPDGSSLAENDKVGIFGNLGHVWCGTEPGFRIMIADQGVTDNSNGDDVNLFDTAQAAVRVVEFFDSVVVDDEAFSIAKMAA